MSIFLDFLEFLDFLGLVFRLAVSTRERTEMQATLYINIALVKEYSLDFQDALENYEIAIKLCRSKENNDLLHKCLLDYANALARKGDIAEGLSSLNEAHKLAKRLKDKKEKVCETLIFKAELMMKEGDFLSAKQAMKKAYRIETSVENDRQFVEATLKVLVTVCRLEDQLVVTNSTDHETRRDLFERLGDHVCKLKVFPKAIEFYKKALEAATLAGHSGKDLIPIYVSLYTTLNDNKQYSEALALMWQEYDIVKSDPKEAQQTLREIALTMKNEWYSKPEATRPPGKFWDIVAIYERAWNEAKLLDDLDVEKPIVESLLKFCKASNMESTYNFHEKEAIGRGIKVDREELGKETEEMVENSEGLGLIGERFFILLNTLG